jgi:4-carboxymuconolactone decarboxylase
VDAIVAGRPATLTDKRKGMVYDVALALANGRLIPQDLHERAVEALGHEGITDLIVLMGYYTCVSPTMNFYSVSVSGGGTPRH